MVFRSTPWMAPLAPHARTSHLAVVACQQPRPRSPLTAVRSQCAPSAAPSRPQCAERTYWDDGSVPAQAVVAYEMHGPKPAPPVRGPDVSAATPLALVPLYIYNMPHISRVLQAILPCRVSKAPPARWTHQLGRRPYLPALLCRIKTGGQTSGLWKR